MSLAGEFIVRRKMSFMYKIKSTSPRMDLCGTPDVMSDGDDVLFSIFTH